MKFKFLGHAAFLITTEDGRKIVTDPYEPGGFGGALRYGKLNEPADFVTISHQHADHNYVKMVPGRPRVISKAGEESFDGLLFRALLTHHDMSKGSERGDNIVHVIEAEGITVCHLGDLGHTLSPEDCTALGPIDVLMVPVGGNFTLDAGGATAVVNRLRPCVAIPMHYQTPKVSFKIAPVEDFLAGKTRVRRLESSELEFTKDSLPEPIEIVVLAPAL